MKKQFILLYGFLLLGIFDLQSQNLNVGQAIKKGRLFTKDGIEKKFKSLTMQNDNVNVFFDKAAKSILLSEEEIIKIEEVAGNQALLWGGVLGASSLLGSIIGVAQAEAQYGDTGDNSGIIIGLTAAGTLVGALVGLNIKKYKTVYENPSYVQSSVRLKLNTTIPNQVPSLTLRLSLIHI